MSRMTGATTRPGCSSDAGNEAGHAAALRAALGLLRPFWPLCLAATALGVAGGLATAGLLAVVNRALHAPAASAQEGLAAFAGLCALSVSGSAAAGALNAAIGQRLVARLRKDICARILKAPLAALEALRPHRLMAVLTGDVDAVSAFTFNVSGYAVAVAAILGGFGYLLVLSRAVFALALACLALACLALGMGTTLLAKRGWIRGYEGVRHAEDDLHAQYRAVIEGAKELKISRPRRARVHGARLCAAADRIAALKSRAMALFWTADATGTAVFFAMIGLVIACRDAFGIDASTISGAIIVLLYVKGPMAQIAGALPLLDQARVSLGRIAALSAALDLDRQEPDLPLDAPPDGPAPAIRSIALVGVTYAFPADGAPAPFVLGPVDLAIAAGELVFLVGANGSGKTTLVKLLLGLYVPDTGEVRLDGVAVGARSRDACRQRFTTVFSDYHLFDDLAGDAAPEAARAHLARVGLAGKVRVEDGRFSTTDLSTGQRKRLALVHALMERRPVLVTDEWAADQDPEFRRLFYEELLPALRAQGRTLLVISHDDRYFHLADRVVRMAQGRIVEDLRVPRGTPGETA